MEYEKPILGEFTARSFFEEAASWARFIRTLKRKGKARITVLSELEYSGQIVGRFSGDFVALSRVAVS